MYFKSLELTGFKSFAERTVIGFEPGITAIVGPNGCGKSNVSDAIRWVLGEQSARRLRGSLMEDFIFNGSAQLDPMGMAQVSLTLGDTGSLTDDEYEEVTVSRRIFRSGESQYFLNKQPCRLKDIHRLFMDTGLGTQAYSFVQQGNIELILSSKPEDRRYLFDETAGITKYKSDKREALRRLEGTEANLLRVGDRVGDVKRRMISIRRQAGKARRYKEFADELQGLEVGFLLHKRGRFVQQMESLQKKRDGVQEVLRRLSDEIEEREKRIRAVRAELRNAELTHEELQSRRLDLLRSIDRESSNISLSEQRIADTRSLSENVSSEINKMRRKVSAMEEAVRQRKESLQTLSEQRSSFDTRLKQKEKRLREAVEELRKAQALSAELSARLLELIRRETELRTGLSSLGESSDSLRQALSQVERQEEEMLQSLERKREARGAAEKEREALSDQLREQKQRESELRAEGKATEESLAALRAEIIAGEGDLSRLGSERRFLAEAVEQYEGYEAGVRAVMEESRREDSELAGIIGAVAGSLEVPRELAECVECALGDRAQWLLVPTMEDAKRAAAYLRNNVCGSATFVAVDRVTGCNGLREAARRLCETSGNGLRPLLDAISFDRRYEKIMEYLFGNVIVVEDLDSALKVATRDGSRFTFVSRSGEKLESGFALTVGKGAGACPSLLSRKARLASLAEEEETQRKSLQGLRRREEKFLAAQKNLAEKAEQQTSALTGIQERALRAERDVHELSATIESLQSRLQELATTQKHTESEAARLGEQRTLFREELKSVGGEKSETEGAISSTRKKVEEIQKEVGSLEKDVTEIALAKASYDERIGNLQSDMEYMRGQLDLTRREMDSRVRQVEEGKTHVRELEAEVQECKAAIASLTEERETTTQAIGELDERRRVLGDELTQAEWEVKEKNVAARERDKEIGDLDVKLTEVRLSVNGIDQRLTEEYGTSHDDPSAAPLPEESNFEEVQSRIAELRRRLQSMGPVNLYAIEEYDDLKKEHDFVVAQQTDLLKAKDSLLTAIAKLDRESRAIFREAFHKIREEFRKMFQRLFGGGRADLILVDESNILDSGIEIIARPPGKKLQTISLLSGGERAMTAISLLFAIFKVKPSPFCLLDEIDAPLDDSNIMRFGEILREFAENSQFIIITHNKRTIATSDVLYGITMEDTGKSKVVSARLTRRDEEASAPPAEASSEFIGADTSLAPVAT